MESPHLCYRHQQENSNLYDSSGNDQENLRNRSHCPRQYSSTSAVIIRATATVRTNPSNTKDIYLWKDVIFERFAIIACTFVRK